MMQDTSPVTARYLRERYAAMSGAERFLVGARMFDTARRIVFASLPADLSPAERRRALFRRLYPELDPDLLQARSTTAKCCGIAWVRHVPVRTFSRLRNRTGEFPGCHDSARTGNNTHARDQQTM